jgi:hypothetical protein
MAVEADMAAAEEAAVRVVDMAAAEAGIDKGKSFKILSVSSVHLEALPINISTGCYPIGKLFLSCYKRQHSTFFRTLSDTYYVLGTTVFRHAFLLCDRDPLGFQQPQGLSFCGSGICRESFTRGTRDRVPFESLVVYIGVAF